MNFQNVRVLSILLKREISYFRTSLNLFAKTHSYYIPKYKIIQPKNVLYLSYYPPKCWQCDYPHKSELFCSKCKALQKLPNDLNYFDIIGVKKDYNVAVEEIQKKYRQLQSLLHPDRFGQKSDKEKEISENLSSLVNKAYSTLINPLDRGIYMLKLHNVSIPEGTTSLEPEFLMKIMELNEEIEEVSENKEKVFELLKKNRSTLDLLTKQISEAFHNEDIDQAKKILVQMKYYISINNRLIQLKQYLGIVE